MFRTSSLSGVAHGPDDWRGREGAGGRVVDDWGGAAVGAVGRSVADASLAIHDDVSGLKMSANL